HRAALALRAQMAADFPAVPEHRCDLARSHNNLGLLLGGQGRWAEAEAAYRHALSVWERLAADFPAVPEYQVNLAGSYGNLGLLLSDRGEPEPALDWFAKAIRTLEPILRQEPRLAD